MTEEELQEIEAALQAKADKIEQERIAAEEEKKATQERHEQELNDDL